MTKTYSYTSSKTKSAKNTFHWRKYLTWFILTVLLVDTIYASWYGITMETRERCVIYQFMPRWLFMTYEYLIELFMVVVAGAFAGSLAEKYFVRYRKLMPKKQITAFLYASLIPVCSCSAIPLIESMKKRLPLRTIISFVMAAPILNPYVIFLSFSVLGFTYGSLRIFGSMVLSLGVGAIVGYVFSKSADKEIGVYKSCEVKTCGFVPNNDLYHKTWQMIKVVAPYIFIAGLLGLSLELLAPMKYIEQIDLNDNIITLLVITLIGTIVYLCNGADILFLAPLVKYADLGMGTAVAFSLTATAICTTSVVMLVKFLGKKLTTVAVISIYVITIALALIINYFI